MTSDLSDLSSPMDQGRVNVIFELLIFFQVLFFVFFYVNWILMFPNDYQELEFFYYLFSSMEMFTRQ